MVSLFLFPKKSSTALGKKRMAYWVFSFLGKLIRISFLKASHFWVNATASVS